MNIYSLIENIDPKLVVISAISSAVGFLSYKFFTKPKQNEFDRVLSYILIADSKELDKILNICVMKISVKKNGTYYTQDQKNCRNN
jgi:hypothetical protein